MSQAVSEALSTLSGKSCFGALQYGKERAAPSFRGTIPVVKVFGQNQLVSFVSTASIGGTFELYRVFTRGNNITSSICCFLHYFLLLSKVKLPFYHFLFKKCTSSWVVGETRGYSMKWALYGALCAFSAINLNSSTKLKLIIEKKLKMTKK